MKNRPIFLVKKSLVIHTNRFILTDFEISGCRWPSVAVGGRRWPSVAVGGRRWVLSFGVN